MMDLLEEMVHKIAIAIHFNTEALHVHKLSRQMSKNNPDTYIFQYSCVLKKKSQYNLNQK